MAKVPKYVLAWFQKTGRQGGKARAALYRKQQLSDWGKLGGRPKRELAQTKKVEKT